MLGTQIFFPTNFTGRKIAQLEQTIAEMINQTQQASQRDDLVAQLQETITRVLGPNAGNEDRSQRFARPSLERQPQQSFAPLLRSFCEEDKKLASALVAKSQEGKQDTKATRCIR